MMTKQQVELFGVGKKRPEPHPKRPNNGLNDCRMYRAQTQTTDSNLSK